MTTDNRTAYDRWAKSYDVDVNSTVAIDDDHFPALWNHVRNQTVLEIGCGTGRHTTRLFEAGNSVTAVDASEGMLTVAREKVARKKTDSHPSRPPVAWINGDYLKLAFDHPALQAASFDVALTSLVLEHLPDLESFFKTTAHLLKKGGMLYISEIHPLRIAQGTQANFLDIETGQHTRLASFAHTENDYLTAAKIAGLELVHNETVRGSEAFARQNAAWSKHIGHPLIQMMAWRKS